MDVVFLDFAKAFDRVAHNILLQKNVYFWYLRCALNWCKDYLTDQEQRVVIERINCTWCAIPSGVPQGSLLGPLFFVIFLSDLPEVVMHGKCVSLYADDCKTSRIINCPADHIRISVRAQLFERRLLLTWDKILTQVSFSFYH